jgi:hypothetical protein
MRLGIVVLIGATLASCTPTTGTRISLTPTNLSKIKSIGVVVKKEEDFSVRLSREEMSNAGAVMLGLIGAGIEAVARRSSDRGIEEQFKPIIADYDPKKPLIDRLKHHLQSSGSFSSSVVADGGEGAISSLKGLDGILEVTLREWGLRRCPGPAAETVQTGFNVNGKLCLTGDHTIVWEREELYLDGDCRPWPAFRSREMLVQDILPRAIDNLASKLVYEIVFP